MKVKFQKVLKEIIESHSCVFFLLTMIFKTFNECYVSLAKNSGQEGVNYTNQITDNIIYISTNEYSNQECVNLYIIQIITIIKPGKIYRGMCNII